MTDQGHLAAQARRTRNGAAGGMEQRLAASFNEAMKAELARRDLTLDQFILLMTLAEGAGLTKTEIGANVRLAGYTVSKAIAAVSARGPVERRPDATSRRSHRGDDGRGGRRCRRCSTSWSG
jgi:DNA-binding MarR family transcriptional regulator